MKRAFTVLLILLLVLSLTACGQGASSGSSSNSKSLSSPYDPAAFVDMNYAVAEKALRDAGFTEITLNAVEDIEADDNIADGSVISVSIAGSSNFTSETQFDPIAEVVINYHSLPRLTAPTTSEEAKSTNYMDIGKRFFDAGFTDIVTDEKYDLAVGAEYETVLTANGTEITDNQIPYNSQISVIGHYPTPKYSTSIVIDFEKNLLFNKYGVIVSLEGQVLSTLAHGEDYTYELTLPAGTYKLSFTNENDRKISNNAEFMVNSATTVNYHISCHTDRVAVEKKGVTHTLTDDSVLMPFSSNHYLRKNYADVTKELRTLGFTNIEETPTTGSLWSPSPIDSVVAITLDGMTSFDQGVVVKKDALVTISYHAADFAFEESLVNVTEKDTFELPYTMTTEDSIESLKFEIDHPEVLVRNEDGTYTALIPGTATVTVSGGDHVYSTCTVEAAEIIVPIESLQLSSEEMEIVVGSTFSLDYTIVPENANYTDMTVQISGPEIEQTGDKSFYANEAGDTVINYYQDDRLIGSCTVHCIVVEIEDLIFDENITEVNMGEEIVLPFSLVPENATCKGIQVVSSKADIAEIVFDERGEPVITVKGNKAGKVIITATVPNGKKVTKQIEVKEVIPTEITLANTTPAAKIQVGTPISLDVKWVPENTSVKELTWSSSDKRVIRVNADGTLEAVGVGTADIKAKHKSGVSATIILTVEPTPVESIKLSNDWNTSKDFLRGNKCTITAVVLPENATNKEVSFKSDNEAVATVTSKGVVTAVKPGKATITATSQDGVTASINVTVANDPPKKYTDSEVKSAISQLLSAGFSSGEYSVQVREGLVDVYISPAGFTEAVYKASVLGDKTAKKDWNSFVSSAKSLNSSLTKDVHNNFNRDDLRVAFYFMSSTSSSGRVYLGIMDGVVLYDYVNGIDYLGLG